MLWAVSVLILALVALLLRQILHMGRTHEPAGNGSRSLHGRLATIYQTVAQEIETQTGILGVTLNEAFTEREASHREMAWHVVRLTTGQWERVAELLSSLHTVLAKFMNTTPGVVVVRRVAVGHFKSRAVIDNIAVYELLDQLLFSSKGRFALQLRFLRRASTLLKKEFRRTCWEGERTLDQSDELWTRLDYFFHDFDLIAKETLLAFRSLLTCQSREGAEALFREVLSILQQGTHASLSPSNR
jgi:hypothetical protein